MLPRDHPLAPKYWVNETGGHLTRAVKHYLEGKKLTALEQLLMKRYLEQWVNSPVWADAGVCPKCGGTGLADAVLTAEELARAIVHKTVKCATCEGKGMVPHGMPLSLKALREKVKQIENQLQLVECLAIATDMGMDPL